MRLTAKQEAFCQLYLECPTASEAYRKAYNAGGRPNKRVWEEASKLLATPKVSQRIDALRAGVAARHAITVDTIVAELKTARQAALAADPVQSSAAISATLGKAKLLGFLARIGKTASGDGLPAIVELIFVAPGASCSCPHCGK